MVLGKKDVFRLTLFFLTVVGFITLIVGCGPNDDWVVVKRVVDGDTFETATGEKVRLIGVDTPESVKPDSPVEPYGKEASHFTKKKLEGKKVRLEYDVSLKDKYGRTLAYVYLPDGTFYNELLLAEGYAQVLTVPPNVKYADHFLEVERKAREAGKGLWGLENGGQKSTDASASDELDKLYVDGEGRGLIKGNITKDGEKIYHMPGGAFYEETKAEAWFKTEREALEAGFRKSKR
ncbi:Micrococcal nuclease-like nuclease [[Clostridium] ultunense Esp]|uniref:thermonuclease family protein n=1 Tax=Thermicanus aegyptius TaxID=94009 RepID=UPI0002B6FBED|nr:thermonuclease family protein [Thermicanus aegyptius]CCQ94867.1 Micrococcal nuclease-like nuclease [[Clostridium] ultunense Esp]